MEGSSPCSSGTRKKRGPAPMNCSRKSRIAHKADAWPVTLSGGQQQRAAIARALAPSPEVLLCDEPTSALDPGLAAEVVEVLKQLASEGMTMLMATHDLRLARYDRARRRVPQQRCGGGGGAVARGLHAASAGRDRPFRVDAHAQLAGSVDGVKRGLIR